MKKFLNKTPIIQVGVGGSTSSGKTYLIESMLRFFAKDNNDQPFYLSDSFKNNNSLLLKSDKKAKLLDYFESLYASVYSRHTILVSSVNQNWAKSYKTNLDMSWHGSTYFSIIKSGKKHCILLYRNIAGETYNFFYENRQMLHGDDKPLYIIFSEFLDNTKYKKKYVGYENLFKMNPIQFGYKKELQNITNKFIGKKKDEPLIDDFINYLKTKEKITNDEDDIRRYFYGFLFFFTSDVKIACMRCVTSKEDREENESKINEAIKGLTENVLICITQFDKILKHKFETNFCKDDLQSLLFSWNQLYEIKENDQPKLYDYVDERIWKNENGFDEIWNNDRYYLTSVSYDKISKCFNAFKITENGKTKGYWDEANKIHHTPIGIFELVHKILLDGGILLQYTGDLFNQSGTNEKYYPKILARLGGKINY